MSSFVIFAALHFPDTYIRRPHPIFWRILLGLHSLYLLFLTYLLFMPLQEGRKVFKFFDQTLGVELPETNYEIGDCAIYTPDDPKGRNFRNVRQVVRDVHFLAHFLGWWFKFLIIRDHWACWIISIAFEVLEQSFKHWIPNFNECWWDYLILDVFGCNLVGMLLGAYTMKLVKMDGFSWVTKHEAVLQSRHWDIFKSPPRYISVVFLCFFVCAVDCMNFFLKFIFWIPANHKLLLIRVTIWSLTGIVGVQEYYEFFTNR
jgi:phosphatidylserine synthase 2